MARIPVDPNYSFPTFPRATAATDIFVKEDVQALAAAVSTHVHDGAGKGLLVGGPAAGSITNAMLGADVARDNQLVNGGMELWQRGVGPFTANGAFLADRWSVGLSGTDTLSASRDTANRDTGSSACAACVFVLGTGGGASNVGQTLRISTDGYQFAGKTISLSVRVRTSTANAVRLRLASDGTGAAQVFSSFHSGGGAYETLTAPACAIPSDATFIVATMVFAASCTAYVDNAMLVVGSQAANYVPMHPADDLARCLRYYELLASPGDATLQSTGYLPGGVQALNTSFPYKVFKPVAPTVTIVGTWGATPNTGQPSTASVGQSGVRLTTNTTAGFVAGVAYVFNNGAATISIEGNP